MEKLILTLLLDIQSFFHEQSGAVHFETTFSGLAGDDFVEFETRISGVAISDEQRRTMDAINFGDPVAPNTGEFSILHSARDTVMKMNGKLHFTVFSPGELCVHVIIPKKHIDPPSLISGITRS